MTSKKPTPPKVPDFKDEAEEAAYWSKHSTVPFAGEEEEFILSPTVRRGIQQRKQLLSIRLDPRYIEQAKQVAEAKGIGYQTLMRMWIVEGLEREKRRKQA